MRNFWLFISVIWLWTCSGGGDKATGPEEPPIVINLTSLGGQAQKGPFNNGTAINVAELTNTLSPTGRNFSSAITDNTGRFTIANVQLESPYVELRANGYYFNEVSNEISSGQLTLFALSNLTGKTSLNVNILTHLEKNRMVTLMSGDNPKTFAQAKLQAQEEVLTIFDYSRADVPESELLDISQSGAANAKLLAMSAIIQGDLTVGQMSQLLANMSTDIAIDGTLDDTNLRNTLIENSKNLDIAEVRSHLEAHYSSLGVSANIADFETEVNQFLKPPEAQDISASIAEDAQINITLAGSDPEGESLTYTILEVNNATVTLNGNVANYTPNANFNGTDTFTYYANDGTSDSNVATVTVTVSAEDDEPNTLDVATTTDEDVAVAVNLSAEEYDGDSYSFAVVSDVSNGTTSLNGSTVTYTPNQDFNGEDTFTFEATDDTGRTINVATATITVNPVNDAPTMSAGTISTDEDIVATLDLSTLSSDVDGDNLTFDNTPPGDGSVTIDGSVLTYTPKANWFGTESFMVTANDGSLTSTQAQIVVTVASVNDVPIANDMTVSTNETRFTSLDITLDVTDADGDVLTYSIVNNAANGTTTLNEGVVTYVPTTDWNGEDSFTFKANDGTVDSNIATTTITVNVVDDAPVVVDSTFVIDEDQVIDITLTASDVDDEDLFGWAVQSDPSNGTVVILDANSSATASKTYRYTPNTNYNGTDSFTYYATNQNAQISNTGTISFTINPVNDGPIANDLTMTVDEDWSGATVTIKGDDNGATDPEGDAITYYIVDAPSNGSVYNDAGGGQSDGVALAAGDELTSSFTIYNPNANYNGTDTFTFKGSDGTLDGNTATVTITVNPVNDAPTVTDVSVIVNEDEAVGADLSAYASDIDGDTLTYFGPVTGPSNGSVTFNNSNFTYTPNANFNGTDSFTFRVNDGIESSDAATVTISVIPGSFGITYGDDNIHETVTCMIATSDGGSVVAGYSYNSEWLVVKFDNGGNAEWEYTRGANEGVSKVIETSDGEIVIAGNTVSGKTVIKLSSSGSVVFINSEVPGDNVSELKEDGSGNLYISGWETVNGTRNGSITKLDSDGNLLWNNTYRKYNSNNEYVTSFIINSNQSLTAVGHGQNAFNNEWMFNVDSSGNASNMTFVDLNQGYPRSAKLLSNGNIQLVVDSDQIVEVNSEFSVVSSINLAVANAGGVIFSLMPTSDGGHIAAGKLNDSSTNSVDDGYLIKYDSSGSAEITKNVSTSLRDWFNSVGVISSGGYYFAGWSRGDDGDWDYYLVKVDSQGNRIF